MTKRAAIVAILGFALATGAYAATAQNAASPPAETQAQTTVPPVPLSWAPQWLLAPLSRAIADATDPRDRT